MTITVKTANFKSNNGEVVAWVEIESGSIPGAKRGKGGKACYNPRAILAILRAGNAPNSALMTDCQRAVDEAEQANQPASTPAVAPPPPPKPNDETRYFLASDGEIVASKLTKEEACKVVKPGYLAIQVGGTAWKDAAEFGIVPDETTPTPTPPVTPISGDRGSSLDPVEAEQVDDPDARAAAIRERLLAGR